MHDESNMSNLKSEVEKLIRLNEEVKMQSRKLNELKDMKSDVEINLQSIMKNLNLEGKKFKLHNNLIIPKRCVTYQSLSMKYVEQCLAQHLNDEEKEKVMNAIKVNRSSKEKQEIRIESQSE